MRIKYSIASTDSDMEQIHSLNYRTFVEEIPQHAPDASLRKVDRFHSDNTYLIGKIGEQLAAMLAVRDQRPFSLDEKLGNIEPYLPFHPQHMVEIRLLAVEKAHRNSEVFYRLAQFLNDYLWGNQVDLAVISGTTRELRLYRRLGFIPFGQMVGTAEATYQPMYMTKASFESSEAAKLFTTKGLVSYCAGPVAIEQEVSDSLKQAPISHRSSEFNDLLVTVKSQLLNMTQAEHVQILLGSGTLANDVVAAQLTLLGGKGLIAVNGEFGQRLVDHAERMGLQFDILEAAYGKPFIVEDIEARVSDNGYTWLWAVHCETSTGMLNDLEQLKQLCRRWNMQLCLDGISSIGAVPLSLKDVYLASAVSGKAIGSYTGLTFVFHQKKVTPDKKLPRYLDLGLYANTDNVPFSQSSNLIKALHSALMKYESNAPYEKLMQIYQYLVRQLNKMGLAPLTEMKHAAPVIVTIPIPVHLSSREIGDAMARDGHYLQYESEYLLTNNFLQIATIGITRMQVLSMARCLGKYYLRG